MRRSLKVIGLLLLTFTVGCSSDDESDNMSQNGQLMVEAYIYANERVDHVKIGRIHDDGEADLIPVNDANVKITQGVLSANLTLKSERVGIYEISDPEVVFSGSENLLLEIVYNGKTYRAITTFPPAITDLSITEEDVNISQSTNSQTPLTTLIWSEVAESQMYCIFARGTESDTSTSYPIQPSQDSPFYALHNDNSIDLYKDHFTHIGSYRLYVSAVNDEYIRMYTVNSTPELSGAPTNIEGAWGVFTAFNGQSVDITVE